MRSYKHIIFDLDHTLWDFTRNSNETLKDLYNKYGLSAIGLELDQFLITYQEVNAQMWKAFNKGQVTKEQIRERRFGITFTTLGLNAALVPPEMNEDFLRICPTKGHLIPYALEVLNYLKGKYVLHILTNGFKEIQTIKLSTSSLSPYFVEVINAESCGYLKPSRQAFEFTLQKISACCDDCIMIGDDLEADVLGAKNAGIDHIFFNSRNIQHAEDLTYEIRCLSELKEIL